MAKGRTSARRIVNGVEYQFGSEGKIKEMLVEASQSWENEATLGQFIGVGEKETKYIERFAEVVQPREIECLDKMTKLDAIAFILDH